ncbi:diguanylate cyclase domain-containing protein [Hoeflea sp.]|uniref:diguanylate cyclase domain-containing protein n=1 Tax=Hoeflea sp. TaxID=1940281 RepID=UPI003A8EF959
MNTQASAASSIALRVATAMYQMGIEGLPRNYELVYEAYSGTNPELTKEFVALGKNKTQRALDELGRKYVPHQHEETHLAKTNDRMRTQMTTFMSLVEEEKSSLTDYSKIISEASRTFASDGEVDQEALNRSIQQLSEATEKQASKSEAMIAEASEQAAQLDGVKADIEKFERMKFVDPLTGLANRRSFNKAAARIYANPELPMMCGLAYAEIDDFKRICEADDKGTGDFAVRHVGHLFKTATQAGDLVAHLDGNRFAFLINTSDEAEIMRVVDRLRIAAGAKPLIHPKTGRSIGHATLSIGIVMSPVAEGAGQLMSHAEKAMGTSSRDGGDRVTFYSNTEHAGTTTGWMIYKP